MTALLFALGAMAVFSCGACAGVAAAGLTRSRKPPAAELQASTEALSLGAVLQMLEQERRSASITLRHGDSIGWIVCVKGQIARARMEETRVLQGGAAVRALLGWTATYVLSPAPDEGPGEGLAITPLLMDSARREDEAAVEAVDVALDGLGS